MSNPIADLSYRNYDGPLEPPVFRWWAISQAAMKLSLKKKGFWGWAAVSSYWYLVLIFVFYFVDTFVTPNLPTGTKSPFFSQIIWKDQFLNAFSISQLLLLIIALLIGIGSIANDNRANALLVYLSKPCTRLDYVVGKWFGIFLPITVVSLVPTTFFYLYCALTYRTYGFLSDDPWLYPRLFLMCMVPGAFHASLCLGVSSLFDQGRLAGATYAGMYFIPLFLTKVMQIAHAVAVTNTGKAPKLVDTLYYFSIDGIQIGLAKVILGTKGSPLFMFGNGGGGRGLGGANSVVGQPNGLLICALFFGVCFASLAVAWSRVRAVEVVG